MLETKIHLHPSKQFIAIILLVIISSLGIIFTLPVSLGIRCILGLFSSLYGMQILWKYGLLRHAHSVVALSFGSKGWRVHRAAESFLSPLSGVSTMTSWVSLLRFSNGSCVVWKDSVESDDYRRLMVLGVWAKRESH